MQTQLRRPIANSHVLPRGDDVIYRYGSRGADSRPSSQVTSLCAASPIVEWVVIVWMTDRLRTNSKLL